MGTQWLRVPQQRPEASARLVCLPHAGGAAGFYAPWASRLDSSIELVSVAYPGRGDRMADEMYDDLALMSRHIAEAVLDQDDERPVALFGHSMGAPVALEVARVLQRAGRPAVHLFASGSRDGALPPPSSPPSEDPDVVVAQLVALGGTDPDLADDPAFRELVVPYVVGDTRLLHGYRMDPEPVLDCPVTAIVGDVDESADRRPWRSLTHAAYVERLVPGGHFYLDDDPPLAVLARAMAARTTKGPLG